MNLHAERAVIGSILMDPDSIAKVSEDLRAEMFENEVYRPDLCRKQLNLMPLEIQSIWLVWRRSCC